jgi:hypothetical protein
MKQQQYQAGRINGRDSQLSDVIEKLTIRQEQKRRDSWVLTRLSTIYSILDGTWSRLNAIEISGSVRSINGARQLP